MPIYAVERFSAKPGPRCGFGHAALNKQKRRTYHKKSAPAKESRVQRSIHVLRNPPGRSFWLSTMAGKRQQQPGRLPLFSNLRRRFEFRHRLIADGNVKHLLRMLRKTMKQTRQETSSF